MEIKVYGTCLPITDILVGTWFPILPSHVGLFEKIISKSIKKKIGATAILIDPHPSKYISSEESWIEIESAFIRAHRLIELGFHQVIVATFELSDLDLGAANFLDKIRKISEIDTLYLGRRQSFGRGATNSQNAIKAYAEKYGFNTKLLNRDKFRRESNKVKNHIKEGKIVPFNQDVGNNIVWCLDELRKTNLCWPDGEYYISLVENIKSAFDCHSGHRRAITITNGFVDLSVLNLPAETNIRWVVFYNGPNDN